MLSRNEYCQLKTVIVGDATGAKIPKHDISLRCVNYADNSSPPQQGLYPQQVIDEANEDISKFVDFLKDENISVLRPDATHDPDYYKFCPRDTVFVHGNNVLYTPMSLRARANEHTAYNKLFESYTSINQEIVNIRREDSLYNTDCIGNLKVLALNETEPCFDAANVLKDNDDLYYLVSNSGNLKGAEMLQQFVGDTAKVHTIEDVYSYMHLDSTIAFLKEGLLLVNPSRIKDKKQLPETLQNWDIIWAPEPIDIGHHPGLCNSSTWGVSLNVFSINEQLVVVEEHQHNLRMELEKHNIDCAMLPMRQARTLGGCFHCITVDVERSPE